MDEGHNISHPKHMNIYIVKLMTKCIPKEKTGNANQYINEYYVKNLLL